MLRKMLIWIFIFIFAPPLLWAGIFSGNDDLVGIPQIHKLQKKECLIEAARKFGIGYNEIVDANPGIDPFIANPGTEIILPSSWILPDVDERDGIVINLPEQRLYYFLESNGTKAVATFPIGIGDGATETPLGNFEIVSKTANPFWHVPPSIRKERPDLPQIVPPGKDNPLGTHALRLSASDILIHGTNRPWAVGRRLTHGCIRLYPEDIPQLFNLAPVGTKVRIINQPVKVCRKGERVYVEIERHDDRDLDLLNDVVNLLATKNLFDKISPIKFWKALDEKSGIPVDITKD